MLLLLAGCDVGYYWQAAGGQLEILRARRQIDEVLEDETVEPETKEKLRLVQAVQTFGVDELALPEEGQYTTYADLGRPQVSWLVVAAPPFALRSVEHCYLIVGCLGYRGYFDRADADEFAAELAEQGYDVIVRPVRAYSTLGWFDDPVLNTVLSGSELELMGSILHEQAHRVVFIDGDTAFNESFAVFVEREGVRRFLRRRGADGIELFERYLVREADAARFRDILRRGRERLEAVYGADVPEPEMRRRKARAFDALRRDYRNERNSFTILNYDNWFAQALNNAHLVSVSQYESRVDAFAALFREAGRRFPPFYDAARALAELEPEARAARLDDLEQQHDRTLERQRPPAETAALAQGEAARR